MSDVRGQSSAFLYFWRRYRDETRGGPIFRVVVLAETLEEARRSTRTWRKRRAAIDHGSGKSRHGCMRTSLAGR